MTDVLLRPDSDTATDGWTDQTGGASNIYQGLDEVTAGNSDFVQSPQVAAAVVDLKVRLFDGATQIVEWTHSDISETFADVEQTLTAPQFAAITSFANLFAEFDDNLGNVYRFRIGDPPGGVDQPIKIRYRYKKLVAGAEDWTPADFGANLVAWYKADVGVYSDAGTTPATNGGTVQQWNDQSGNGHHITTVTFTAPLFLSAGFNGSYPTVATSTVFARGLRTAVDSVALGTAATASVFVAGQMRTECGGYGTLMSYWGNGLTSGSTSPSSCFLIRDGGGADIINAYRSGVKSTKALADDTPSRIGSIYDGANHTTYVNNSGGTPVADTTAFTSPGTIVIGSDSAGANFGGYFISEMVVTKHAMTSGERAALDAYFVERYFTFDAATVAWVAQVVTNGGTVSSGRQTLVDALIVGLKADGVWAKLDRLWLFAGEDAPSALTDLVGLALATAVSTPSFTADRGYSGVVATSAYVNTNFNASTAGGNFTQNSAHVSVWDVTTSLTNANRRLFGQESGSGETHIYPSFAGSLYGRINNGSNAGFAVAGPEGHSLINRSGASATETYKNGSSLGSDTVASGAVVNANFTLGADGASGGGVTDHQFAASSIGGSLSATDAGNLYNRLRTYMTAVGVVAPLLLDGIANVSGVWSFRRLLTSYAGNCCRIRRSSDNAEQNFGFVSDVVDTAGIATFIGGGSGYIVTWYDQTGTNDVTQSTSADQPLFVASGINSLPTARFDGAGDFLVKNSVASSTVFNTNEGTILFVQNQAGSNGQNTTIALLGSNLIQIHATYSDVIYFDFGTTVSGGRLSVSQPTGWDDAGHVSEFYRTTGDVQGITVDGTSLTTNSRTDIFSTTATFVMGAYSGGAFSLMGDLSELVFIKTDTGSTNRATIRRDGVGAGVSQSMGDYYGITVI